MPSQSNQQCSPEALTSWAWLCVLVGLFGSQEVSLHWPLWSHGSYSEAFWSFGSLSLFYTGLQTPFVYKVENVMVFTQIYSSLNDIIAEKFFHPTLYPNSVNLLLFDCCGVFLWYLLLMKWFGWLPAAPQAAKSHMIKMSFHFSLRKRQKATSDRKA